MLASVLSLGSESHVQAGDEVLRGRRVVTGCGEAGREFAQGVVSAKAGADLSQTGLLALVSVGGYGQEKELDGHSQDMKGSLVEL